MERIKEAWKRESIFGAIALIVLLVGLWSIFAPFSTLIVWAAVMAAAFYPLFRRLMRFFPRRAGLLAFGITLLLGAFLLFIFIPLVFYLTRDLDMLISFLERLKNQNFSEQLGFLESLPFLHDAFVRYLAALPDAEQFLVGLLGQYKLQILKMAGMAAQGILLFMVDYFLCLFVFYFFLRHGAALAKQLRAAGMRLFGVHSSELLETVKYTVRAAVYGMLLTALLQGILAGIAYAVVGAPVPIVLALLTMLFALIPFGTPVVYLSVFVWLISIGTSAVVAIIFLAWCIIVVSSADNVIRPIFISQATDMPVLLVFFGVIGGILSFGSIGLFIGPVLIAISLVLWRELAHLSAAQS